MKNFFLSLKTTVWTLLALVVIFFAGSYLMPVRRDVHGAMNDRLLFQWVADAAAGNLDAAWWFFASLAGLVLLTINTIVCSVQAVRDRWPRADFMVRISPQLIHLGFLLILLAHLASAGWGYRLMGELPQGAGVRLPDDRVLALRHVRAETDGSGNLSGWAADVVLMENGMVAAKGTLGPNRPLLHRGVGIYLKSFEPGARPAALLMVNKDPGAVCALAGACLFTVGSTMLLALKWKKT